jgi:hypothetical protein
LIERKKKDKENTIMVQTADGFTLWYAVTKPSWSKGGIWYEEIYASKDGKHQVIGTANTQYKTKREATAAAEKRLQVFATLVRKV